MVSRILCLAAVATLVSGATFQGRHPAKPNELAHKEGCYVKEVHDVIPFDEEVFPIGHCYRIECAKWGIAYATCGSVFTDDPKCHVTDADLRRPYPDCCPDVRCDVENNIA